MTKKMKNIKLDSPTDELKSKNPASLMAREAVSRHLDDIAKILIETGVGQFEVTHTSDVTTIKGDKREYVYSFAGKLISAKEEV